MSVIRLGAAALLLCMVSGCALRTIDGCRRCLAPQMSELWTEPDAGRDLFWGPEESKPRRIRMRSTDSRPATSPAEALATTCATPRAGCGA